MIAKKALVVFLWQVQFWIFGIGATSQCETDGAAYLQRKVEESSVLAMASGLNYSGNCNGIETGQCVGVDKCKICTPDSNVNGEVIPNDFIRFPDGKLDCSNTQEGAGGVCQSGSTSRFWKFKDANDYQVCEGYQACYNSWLVENLGGACCTGYEACYGVAKFDFYTKEVPPGQPAATCKGDVCCDGYQSCYGSAETTQFLGVRDLSCRGENTCVQMQAHITRNLFCSGNSKDFAGPSTCKSDTNNFTFYNSTSGASHCVTCESRGHDNVCGDSDFFFDTDAANVNFNCRARNSDADPICNSAKVHLTGANQCLLLNCPSSRECNDMAIDIQNPGTSKCYCIGNGCGNLFDLDGDPFSCITEIDGEDVPEDICGSTICEEPLACCDSDLRDDDPVRPISAPKCGSDSCGCTPPPASVSTSTMGGQGDPHIDTMDKQHYLLLKQGTFSFWRYSGIDAEVFSAKELLKKVPVDFKIYTHYSGHTSYTKGLMLVDNSGGDRQRVLELTSEDCTWRTKAGDDEQWTAVDKPQLLSVPDKEGDVLTAFRMTQSSKGQKMHVELLLKKADGSFKNAANLYMRCKPGYHINTKLSMNSKADMDLVKGQLGAFGHTEAGEDHETALLQGMRTRSDQEFLTREKWTDLGGSAEAAAYLSEVDEEGPSFLRVCSSEEKIEAKATCQAYLGDIPSDKDKAQSYQNRLDDCIFDVCNGGGTVAAELAAEIFEAD